MPHPPSPSSPGIVARRRGMAIPPVAVALTVAVSMALATTACGDSTTSPGSAPGSASAGPGCIKTENGGDCLPLAPKEDRVDLATPTFSKPTSVTNPLHPTSMLEQVVYGGQVDGEPFRTEFTRLRNLKTITWDGKQVDTVVMQYLAFSGGRIHEVALDWFAQADDGSVWYFGEDVFNYDEGVLADTEGTWQAGRDGPPAMIMPADPKVGDAYRSENIPGLVFEEVTVRSVDETVAGPGGPVNGAIIANELHMDGKREDKIFAPGYGEFSTGSPSGDLEQVSLAVPTDVRPENPAGPGGMPDSPAELAALSDAVHQAFDTAGREDWDAASAASKKLDQAWEAYRSTGVPDLLGTQMSRDIEALAEAIDGRDGAEARDAALRVAQNELDLQLRHRPVTAVDLARIDLWTRQLVVDTTADEAGAVSGDVFALQWTWDRVRHAVDEAIATGIDTQIRNLRSAADDSDLAAVAKATPALQSAVAGILRR